MKPPLPVILAIVVAPPVIGIACIAFGHWIVGAIILIGWLALMFYAMSEPF